MQDYRGAKLIWHGGGVYGSVTSVALLPDKNVGIFVAVNSWETEIARGLMHELLDHYLGYPQGQWPEKLHEFLGARLADAAQAVKAAAAKPAPVGPSLPLARYAGDYADPWYGTIKVRQAGGALSIEFPHSTGMSGPLTHYQYDTFKTNPSLNWIEPAYVSFLDRCRREGRSYSDEAGFAGRRLQLGLSGPVVYPRRRAMSHDRIAIHSLRHRRGRLGWSCCS